MTRSHFLTLAAVSAALLAGLAPAASLGLGCSVPDLSYSGKACTGTCPDGLACIDGLCSASALGTGVLADAAMSSAEGGISDATCPTSATIDPCVVLPMFPGQEVVDGYGSDFCQVPVFIFNPYDEQLTSTQSVKSPALSFDATVQAAWSGGPTAAFHVYVHVPKWPVAFIGPGAWAGDAVEILVAGSAPTDLTGDVEGDPGTTHVIVAPSLEGGAGTATVFPVNNDLNGPGTPPSLGSWPASLFAARIEPGVGYDVEIEIPWSSLGPPYPTLGSVVGFDVGIDVALPTEDGGLEWYQSFHKVLALTGGETPNGACGTDPHPSCDDRTWCQPTLGDL